MTKAQTADPKNHAYSNADLFYRLLLGYFGEDEGCRVVRRRLEGEARAHLSGVVFGEHCQCVAADIVNHHWGHAGGQWCAMSDV